MKVLYVEDNPANVFLVKRVARMGNHEIINYIDGGQALKKYDEINPDLVLMDIQLAGDKTGLDVVRELRARGIKTTIIAVTAYAMVGDKERCIEAGCDDYLAKPLPIPRLVEIFETHSKKIGAAPTAASPKAAAPVAEAPKAETPKPATPVAEAPKAETPKTDAAPVAEAAKTDAAAPTAETPKANAAPVAESPKAETPKWDAAPVAEAAKTDADAPTAETPKAAVPPVAEAPKPDGAKADSAAPTAETPKADAAEKPRTPTAPLVEAEVKPADTSAVNEVKAVEEAKPTPSPAPEVKAAEDGKKEVEQSSVKPETSSN